MACALAVAITATVLEMELWRQGVRSAGATLGKLLIGDARRCANVPFAWLRASLQRMKSASIASAAQAGSRRPRSLKEVALWGQSFGDTDGFLREFLDGFYVERDQRNRAAMLVEEPPMDTNDRHNAYLAAVAEHLALKNRLPVPDWTGHAARFLSRPYFPCGLESLKATLLMESPNAFRRRMIFVGADPLYRPRRDASGIGSADNQGELLHHAETKQR